MGQTGEQLVDLKALLGSMTDLVFVFDREGRWLWAAEPLVARGEDRRANAGIVIGKTLHEVLPGDLADRLLSTIHAALETNETQYAEYPVDWLGGQLWFLAAVSPMPNDNVVWVARNITGRKLEEERLAEEIKVRTRDLEALVQTSRALSSTLALQPLLDATLDMLRSIVPYDGAGVLLLERGVLQQIAVRRPAGYPGDDGAEPRRTPVERLGPYWQKLEKGEAIVVDDVWGNSEGALMYRSIWDGDLRGTPVEYVHSWISVPLIARDRPIGILSFASAKAGRLTAEHAGMARAFADQAALAIENARLFERTERRERELAAVLEISRTLASTLDAGEVLGAIVDQLGAVMKHTGASVLLIRDDAFEFVEARSITGARARAGARIPFEVAPVLAAAMRRGEAVIIDDVKGDEPMAADYRASIESVGLLDRPPFNVIRSWMAVPLAIKDRVLGMLTISWTEPAYFTDDHSRVARVFADQAALAIENARLYAEAERRARESEALTRADAELFRSLDLDAVLQALVDVTVDILGSDKSMVATWDAESEVMSLRASRNLRDESLRMIREMYERVLPRMQDPPAIIATEVLADAHPAEIPVAEAEGIQSFIQVPIVSSSGVALGFFVVAYTREHHFDSDEQRLLTALAERAAAAVSNADLHERAQRSASLEERQRLARELHDSVSQALYGIALGARTARTILDRDPVKAVEPVDYVLTLAEAGLAEMRALIFELRPESLEMEGIVAALNKQIAATTARYEMEITAELCDEPDLKIEAKEMLYRVAQEALHNVVKHAGATAVSVRLRQSDGSVTLSIADNGKGFDPAGDFPGHLGLRSMRERALAAGGNLTIASTPGAGTTVTVTVAPR
jgi:signal transduction histidine kinase